MKRLVITIALTCVLSGSALAGEMPTCGITAPAPGGTQSSAVGDMPTVPAAESSGAQSSAVVTVLLTIINLVV